MVVLEESEFKDGKDLTGRPLPYIEVENAAQVFPPFDQLWAWAHVHFAPAGSAENAQPVMSDRKRHLGEELSLVLTQSRKDQWAAD